MTARPDFHPDAPKHTTRSGLPARIICTDAKGELPIIALVTVDGGEQIRTYRSDGHWSHDGESWPDLIDAPVERVVYVNDYGPARQPFAHESEEAALSGANRDCLGTHRIVLSDSTRIQPREEAVKE
jgi:hypothetical protein